MLTSKQCNAIANVENMKSFRCIQYIEQLRIFVFYICFLSENCEMFFFVRYSEIFLKNVEILGSLCYEKKIVS